MLKHTTFKQTQIRFSDEGKGRAIIFLHGFLENHEIWNEFSKQFSKRFRVIAIDLPGHGETPAVGYIHSMEMMAACVKTVADKLKLRKYILVGHSMGGYVAMAFAELFPRNLKGVCLFHSSARADSEEKKLERARTIKAIKKNHIPFVEGFFEKLFAAENAENFKTEIRNLRISAAKLTRQSIVNSLEGMKERPDREIILRSAKIPFLFIIGKKDVVLNYENLIQQTENNDRSSMILLENAGHMGFLEEKEKTLKAISRFSSKCFRRNYTICQ